MRNRSLLGALLITGVLIPITSCISSPSLTSIVVTPNVVNFGGQGVTSQLTATGYYTHPNHQPITKNITDQVTWATSADQCVTVSKTGFITSGGNICSNILVSASMPGFHGLITGTMTVNVTQPTSGGGATGGSLLSINIVPGDVTVTTQSQTQQYLAFGSYSTAPTLRDLTNQVTWVSLEPQVATIETAGVNGATSGGLATAEGYTGNASIFAEAQNPDGTLVVSNAVSFTCRDPQANACLPGPADASYVTLTVFMEGTNTTDWLVTAPSVTGTPNLIHCGPAATGGSVCAGTYPTGATVTLTESGTHFNGWSENCDVVPATPNLTNQCTVSLKGNQTVGVIFN